MNKLSEEQVANMTLKEVVADYCRIKNGVDDTDIAEALAFINKLLPIDEFLKKSEAREQISSLAEKELSDLEKN